MSKLKQGQMGQTNCIDGDERDMELRPVYDFTLFSVSGAGPDFPDIGCPIHP
jgi:hypothetical protein